MSVVCPKCKAAISEPLGEQIKAEEERAKAVEYHLRREIVDLRGQIRVATQKLDDLLEAFLGSIGIDAKAELERTMKALRETDFSKAWARTYLKLPIEKTEKGKADGSEEDDG